MEEETGKRKLQLIKFVFFLFTLKNFYNFLCFFFGFSNKYKRQHLTFFISFRTRIEFQKNQIFSDQSIVKR